VRISSISSLQVPRVNGGCASIMSFDGRSGIGDFGGVASSEGLMGRNRSTAPPDKNERWGH
jgi:hypothetical protein